MENAADRGFAEGISYGTEYKICPKPSVLIRTCRRKAYLPGKGKIRSKAAATENAENEMKEITEKLERALRIFPVRSIRSSSYTMAKFPRTPINNNLLIMLQKPDASLCSPIPDGRRWDACEARREGNPDSGADAVQDRPEQNKLDEKGQTILDKDGEPVKETVQISMTGFKPVSTLICRRQRESPFRHSAWKS
jgi:hypothetical protein